MQRLAILHTDREVAERGLLAGAGIVAPRLIAANPAAGLVLLALARTQRRTA